MTDFGCGVGYYVAQLSAQGYDVYAVEGTPGIESVSLYAPILQADLSEPLTLDIPHGEPQCICMCVDKCVCAGMMFPGH